MSNKPREHYIYNMLIQNIFFAWTIKQSLLPVHVVLFPPCFFQNIYVFSIITRVCNQVFRILCILNYACETLYILYHLMVNINRHTIHNFLCEKSTIFFVASQI